MEYVWYAPLEIQNSIATPIILYVSHIEYNEIALFSASFDTIFTTFYETENLPYISFYQFHDALLSAHFAFSNFMFYTLPVTLHAATSITLASARFLILFYLAVTTFYSEYFVVFVKPRTSPSTCQASFYRAPMCIHKHTSDASHINIPWKYKI